MMICTVTVTVTPAATAPTMSKKKNEPKIVTNVLFEEAECENKSRIVDPAGNVATTIKISAETISDQPARNPNAG